MSLYSVAAKLADKMINQFGNKEITISKTTGGTFDPVLGKTTGGTATSQAVQAYIGATSKNDFSHILDSLTYKKVCYALMSGKDLDFEPELEHTVTIDAETWAISAIKPVRSDDNGTMITYELALTI